MLTELVPVGMGQPDSLVVGDHHEQQVRVLLYLGRQGLQLPGGQLVGERRTRRQRDGVITRDVGTHGGGEGDRTGHVQRLVLVLGGEAFVAEVGEHAARDAQRQYHYGDLQQQNLGCESHIHASHPRHGKRVRGILSRMRKSRRDRRPLRTRSVMLG